MKTIEEQVWDALQYHPQEVRESGLARLNDKGVERMARFVTGRDCDSVEEKKVCLDILFEALRRDRRRQVGF